MTKWKETEMGEIPENWEVKELKDVLEHKGYIRGPFGSTLRRPELEKEGIPVYEQQNAIYNHRIFRFYVSEEKYNKLRRFAVKENDLIVSCSGTFGKVSIIQKDDPKGIISQALLILRPNTQKINPYFLKYFFTSNKGFQAIESRSLGSVQVNIANRGIIEKIELAIPKSRREQDNIVKILSDLDSKIELNNQMNATLEAMTQAIFKHWFIDFEFPDENGKPYKSSGGEMVDSELGKIPEGWSISKIGKELCTVLGGTPSTSKKEYWTSGTVPWINSGKINEFRIIEPAAYITEAALNDSATKLMPKGTTVLAITGATLGQVSMIESEMCGNQSVIGILGNQKISSEYIYLFIKNSIRELILNQTGGAQQHINKENVDNFGLLVPQDHIMKQFTRTVKLIFNQISNNCFESLNLSKSRDSLLPKLMSGQIRVPIEVLK